MTVTEIKNESRNLKTGLARKGSAEHERYEQLQIDGWITENNISTTNTQGLLELILAGDNMQAAKEKVKSNKGAAGIDGMRVDGIEEYFAEHGLELMEAIKSGRYKPKPVRRVEIPKDDGKSKRPLGIPTVIDRVIQQAIAQVLTPIFEEQFSENSYGFRPGRSAHDAIRGCQRIIDEGYCYAVDLDLEKFFDTVNQSKLIEVLSRTIKDGRVISIIHKYLRAGVVVNHSFKETEVGTPQGGPLSPLLSNVLLNELDKELTKRGHRFIRYADDAVIFCKSRRAAERTLASITRFIEKKLFLKVNRDKTKVDYVGKINFLGFSFYQMEGVTRVRIHPKSKERMRKRVRELTNRNNGWGYEYRRKKLKEYIRGWVNYYRIADIRTLLVQTDQWMRRRIRAVYWKQWKRVRTRYRYLRKLGLSHQKAYEFANTRKKYWRVAGSYILTTTLTNQKLKEIGFLFFTDYFDQRAIV